jgi:hypothetical protein
MAGWGGESSGETAARGRKGWVDHGEGGGGGGGELKLKQSDIYSRRVGCKSGKAKAHVSASAPSALFVWLVAGGWC